MNTTSWKNYAIGILTVACASLLSFFMSDKTAAAERAALRSRVQSVEGDVEGLQDGQDRIETTVNGLDEKFDAFVVRYLEDQQSGKE